MRLEVNIEKKHVFMILGSLLILAGVVFVVGQGVGVPNPGHDWAEVGNIPNTADRWPTWGEVTSKPNINDCSGSNKALKTVNLQTGAVTCEADDVGGGGGGIGTLDCLRQQGVGSTATCPGGYFVTGGGADCGLSLTDSYPSSTTQWKVVCDGGLQSMHVICCRVI